MTEPVVEPEVTAVDPAQAATVVVDTSAVAEAAAEEAKGELLAGKFKTPEDLEKAYKELESKLGGNSQQPAAEETPEAKAEEAPEDKTPEGEEANNTEDNPYGEVVAGALDKAGVTIDDVVKEYGENSGALGEETYGKLEEAGFPKAIVEAYLRGLEAEAAQAEDTAVVTDAQIIEIKKAAGGDEGYSEMTAWMQANLSQADIDAYNTEVGSGDVVKATAAVTAMAAKRTADVGTEPTLVGGSNDQTTPGYASEAAWLEDMAKPAYKTSQAFRDTVAAKLAASTNVMLVA